MRKYLKVSANIIIILIMLYSLNLIWLGKGHADPNWGGGGDSDIGTFDVCNDEYNGCIGLDKIRYTIVRSISVESYGGLLYKLYRSSTSYTSYKSYYASVPNKCNISDNKGTGVFWQCIYDDVTTTSYKTILQETGIDENTFFSKDGNGHSIYSILVEPLFTIYKKQGNTGGNTQYKSSLTASEAADTIQQLFNEPNGTTIYSGFGDVVQMIPCSIFINYYEEDSAKNKHYDKNRSYCIEAADYNNIGKYLELPNVPTSEESLYGKGYINASDINRQTTYDLTIIKYDNSLNLLKGVKFSSPYGDCTTGSDGKCTIKGIPSGTTVNLTETVPSDYQPNNINCDGCVATHYTSNVLKVTMNRNKTITVYNNKKTCQSEIEDLKNSVGKNDRVERIRIYEKYLSKGKNYKNLLNFSGKPTSSTSASVLCSNTGSNCNSSQTKTPGCLSYNIKKTFSKDDLSCYDYTVKVKLTNGEATAYCANDLQFLNNIVEVSGGLSFGYDYNFLTQKYNFGRYRAGEIFLSTKDSENYVAKSIITSNCYTYTTGRNATITSVTKSNIENVEFTLDDGSGNMISEVKTEEGNWKKTGPVNAAYSFSKTYVKYYRFREIILNQYSGSMSNDLNCVKNNTCTIPKYGLSSKIATKDGTYKYTFSFDYNNGNKSSNETVTDSCEVEIYNDLIPSCKIVNGKYYNASGKQVTKAQYDKECGGNTPIPTPLNIEFREIDARKVDSLNAFPGKLATGRIVGSNWRTKGLTNTLAGNGEGHICIFMTPRKVGEESKFGYFQDNYKYDYNNDGWIDSRDLDFYYYAHNSLSDSYISENKTSKNNVLIQYILDTTNNSYNKNHTSPMYTINLTPSLIKEIREYNKDHKAYEDDYTCTSEISNCTSDFIKKYIGKKNTTNTTETVPKYNFTGCNALSY